MYIKEIKRTNKKITVILSDDSKFNVLDNVFAEHNLYVKKEIDEKEVFKIKEDNKVEEYFSLMCKRLVLKAYSPNKVVELLKEKGANKTQIEKVLEKLRKYDLLNEENLVKLIIEKCDIKHYGFNRIIKMLNDKQISSSEIAKVKYNLKREENEGKLQTEILLKKCKNKNDSQTKNYLYQSLVRYGFDESLAKELVEKSVTYNHNHELNVLKLTYTKYFLKYSIKYQGIELDRRISKALLCKGYKYSDINIVKENYHEMDKRIS